MDYSRKRRLREDFETRAGEQGHELKSIGLEEGGRGLQEVRKTRQDANWRRRTRWREKEMGSSRRRGRQSLLA